MAEKSLERVVVNRQILLNFIGERGEVSVRDFADIGYKDSLTANIIIYHLLRRGLVRDLGLKSPAEPKAADAPLLEQYFCLTEKGQKVKSLQTKNGIAWYEQTKLVGRP